MDNQVDEWRRRLLVADADPESFLMMAKVLAQTVEWAERGLAQEGLQRLAAQTTPVDWQQTYQTAPHVLPQLTRCVAPSVSGPIPSEDAALGSWVRATMDQIHRFLQKADRVTDPKTGLFTEAGMQLKEVKALVATAQAQLTSMLVEVQATFDSITALLTWETPMPALMTRALAGEETALLRVLSLNSHLVYRSEIMNRIQQMIAGRESVVLHALARALESRPQLRKNATIGFILLVLWDAGLRRLTSNQLRGFLKAVGVQDLPPHQALERYRERLGLKKNVRD